MKIVKQRNPYLKRITPLSAHKYSYDIDKGKYFLHSENGTQKQINKIGTFKPKFKHYFSGFATTKERYNQTINNDPVHLHYVPDFKYDQNKSYYTPMLDKFAGYAQYPYKLKQKLPEHLNKHTQKINSHNSITMRKSQSQHKKQIKTTKKDQTIFQHSMSSFMNPEQRDKYFNLSFTSMTESKPLPKKSKRTCYNYKCKHLKYFVFDQKTNFQQSTKYSLNNQSTFSNTLGKSFYQTTLKLQGQQTKYLEQFG